MDANNNNKNLLLNTIPVIDISPLIQNTSDKYKVGESIGAACRSYGFFYISGHGVSTSLQDNLENLSSQFFALPLETKLKIHMRLGGRAWRGYFPFGNELTSGQPDQKEGLYFGEQHAENHPLVQAKVPLHGPNLFLPEEELPGFECVVYEYMSALTAVGQALMRGIALSFHLPEDYFYTKYTTDPTTLFQIMNYPPKSSPIIDPTKWGISPHTDYGLLTILKQDTCGGLEIKVNNEWIPAPPIPATFVCNIGDMLDRITSGLFKSTLHRVRNPQLSRNRLSFPFFFDPNFMAIVEKIEGLQEEMPDDQESRWDHESVRLFNGTYGEYLVKKVSRVFPKLKEEVLVSN